MGTPCKKCGKKIVTKERWTNVTSTTHFHFPKVGLRSPPGKLKLKSSQVPGNSAAANHLHRCQQITSCGKLACTITPLKSASRARTTMLKAKIRCTTDRWSRRMPKQANPAQKRAAQKCRRALNVTVNRPFSPRPYTSSPKLFAHCSLPFKPFAFRLHL